MEARKQAFGLDESVDMVVKPGESIRVGKETVPLDDILAQIRARTPAGPETRRHPRRLDLQS